MSLFLRKATELLDYIAGSHDSKPDWLPRELGGATWGLWWAMLLGLIILFSGQSSKFIYIDF